MKTIEERAKEYSKGQLDKLSARAAYIAGASEQKQTDIIRVSQFLARESAYNGSMACIDDLLIEELCKAMDE